MKHPSPRHGQPIFEGQAPVPLGRVAALIIAPTETLLLSFDGAAPGRRLDPARWAAAVFDPRRQGWILPAEDGAA